MTARILTLHRLPVAVINPDDNVVAESINLRCARCGARWSAALGPFGDEVEEKDAHCPRCVNTPLDAA